MFNKILIYNASPVTGELTEIFIDLFRKNNCEVNIINIFDNFQDDVLYFIICPAGLNRYNIKPKNYIVYQLESYLYKEYNLKWMSNNLYLEYLKSAKEIWDYSEYNIKYLNENGIFNTKFVPIGFHSSLSSNINIKEKDIDVLFLGGISFYRRLNIYNEIKKMNYNVVMVEGKSFEEIIPLIKRAKISLNIHAFGPNILETVRLSLLLSNQTCVISEVSYDKEVQKKYEDGGVIFCEYENIIETTTNYLQNLPKIELISAKSHEWYKNKLLEIPDLSEIEK